MSAGVISVEGLRAPVADAVRPHEVYAAFEAWCASAGLPHPVAAYLVDSGGDFARDRAAFAGGDGPARVGRDGANEVGPLLPYGFRGRTLGGLLFAEGDRAEAELLRDTFESECASALFRAAYLQETIGDNARMKEQLFYHEEMGKLLGQLDLDLLLVNILELTSDHLGADLGSITLLGAEGRLATAVDWGLPHDGLVSLTLNDGTPVLERVLTSRQPLLLTEADIVAEAGSPYRFDRLLLLPLCTKDAVWGSINLLAPRDIHDVESPAIASARSGVALAATAVENALLLEIKLAREREQEQLKVAQQIQASLLPSQAPATEEFDIAGSSVPATMIGGDYFDYFELPDGRTGMVVADVAGKGVPAGLIMTATRALFRAATSRHSDPGAVLEEVNTLLCAEDFGSRFVTAVFAAIDPRRDELGFACAGHDSPLFFRAERREVQEHPLPALPLGLQSQAGYRTQNVPFNSGDVAVLFTDGVSEAMDGARQQFGLDQLRSVLFAAQGQDAPGVLGRIVDAVSQHCAGAPRHDDTTLIVVRKTHDSRER